MTTTRLLSTAAAVIALASAMGTAQATIINIDATTSATTSIDFDAGTYEFAVIGKDQGGLYDGWTYNTGGAIREAVTVGYGGSTNSFDVDLDSTKFASFSTTSAALASAATGPYLIYSGTTDGNVVGHLSKLELILPNATSVTFGVPDYQFNDNSGGVSLSVTSAVPEPETYALMLAGLGAMAFVARRRKAA